MKQSILFLALVATFVSCTKEIDIDLNETDPKYIIEATANQVFNQANVKITKTVNFDETIPNPTVSGAIVTISNNIDSQIDTFVETSAGIYQKNLHRFDVGSVLTLRVTVGGKTFTSVGTVPPMIDLTEATQENLAGNGGAGGGPGGGPGGNTGNGLSNISFILDYPDPAGVINYYQIAVSRNDTLQNDIFVRTDEGMNGNSNIPFVRVEAKKNDIVKIDLQHIEKTVYSYFYGLSENIQQSSATPANPKTNIDNGGLGYFKIYSSSSKIVTIQ